MSEKSIIVRLKEAHAEAQRKKEEAHCIAGEALVAYAGVGRLIDESGLSPEEVEAIDPEIERARIQYHAAKRWVASHPNQLEFGSFKLLMDRSEQEHSETSPKSPTVEATRLAGNFLKYMGKVDLAKLGPEERWTIKLSAEKFIEALNELRGKL